MKSELKPCPFCGGEPNLVDDRIGWFVRCNHCKPYATVIYGKRVREVDTMEVDVDDVDWDDVKQSAVDAWNTRTTEQASIEADRRTRQCECQRKTTAVINLEREL